MTTKPTHTPGPWWEGKETATMADFERLKRDATELLEALICVRYFLGKEYKALPEQAFDRPDWNRLMEGVKAAISKADGR